MDKNQILENPKTPKPQTQDNFPKNIILFSNKSLILKDLFIKFAGISLIK